MNETASNSRAIRRITISDLVISISLPFLFGLSWFTNAGAWPIICRSLARLIPFVLGQDKRSLSQHTRARVGQRKLSSSADEIVRDYLAAHIERKLLTLRLYRPGHWQPSIRFLGQEYIDSALHRGKGVVLWDSNFAFASLLTKMALFQAGYCVCHLSQPSHGFDSSTKYGIRFLNPLIWSIEKRYLLERVELSLRGSALAMRTLMRRLNDNGVVSITVRDTLKNRYRFPFLDGTVGIAGGAPYLALKTGAALLPVFTLRDDNSGYLVTVDPELMLPANGSSQERIQFAVREYIERLTTYVVRKPGEWRGWSDR